MCICTFIGADVSLRLAGGTDESQGRVEIGIDGVWGTMCHLASNSMDIIEATVICRQLGYGKALAATYKSSFGSGYGRVWSNNINCYGEESSILDCSGTWGIVSTSTCNNHNDDFGVICGGT